MHLQLFSLSHSRGLQVLAAAATDLCAYWHRGCTSMLHPPRQESLTRARAVEIDFVFGGAAVLGRRFLLSLVVALSLSTLASANSATVNMTFLYPGTNASGGYYTYPYYFSINGGKATPMMCDSFNNHISAGEDLNGNISGLVSGKWLFWKGIVGYTG